MLTLVSVAILATTPPEPAGPSWTVTTDLSGLVLIAAHAEVPVPFSIDVEHAIGPRASFHVQPTYFHRYPDGYDPAAWGLGVAAGMRWFVWPGPAPRGLWVGLDLGLGTWQEPSGYGNNSALGALIQTGIGWNITFGRFCLSPALTYYAMAFSSPVTIAGNPTSAWAEPGARLNVGAVF